MRTDECLAALAEHRTAEVVIASMTSAVRWPAYSDHPRDLIYVPSTMGGAPSLGLGLALARPDLRVVVLNGDGSMLMSLGSLVTIGEQAPPNLVLVVFDNGMYAVTGGQPTPGAGQVDFASMALAARWPITHRFSQLGEWAEALPGLLRAEGPAFVQLTVEPEPTSITAPPVPMSERLTKLLAALD
ncbi:MAG: thiamine pyrophosphate-binding protein [Armatimonadetes bacterium]|nr:thiamine pyrophosphate-binding protein [Armatimonadota bacterium]